jgi:hypothetical protein
MCLIFDQFPSRNQAEAFAKATTKNFGLNATVYDSQEESNRIDPFPFHLEPPIVLVDRPWLRDCEKSLAIEAAVEKTVGDYKGEFAGT